jgi:hypothetical protein
VLKLRIGVPRARDRAATAVLYDGSRAVSRDDACGSASPELAAKNGNPACDPLRPFGHPPLGSYALLASPPPPPECGIEYGSQVLLFEPAGGEGLQAESFGRLLLAVYAGPPGRDGRLRRTQGGVRLSESMMKELLVRLGPGAEMELSIEPLEPRWWQFWANLPVTPALSSEPPHLTAPPLDEASIVALLSQGLAPRIREPRSDSDDDWGRSSDRGSSSSRSDQPFEDRGGQYGGAGASGRWDEAGEPSTQPSGVSPSGQIAGLAAGAALGAALSSSGDSASEDAGTQTGTSY